MGRGNFLLIPTPLCKLAKTMSVQELSEIIERFEVSSQCSSIISVHDHMEPKIT